jgi:glycosyltransferase involved in cell wall biosynthesis
LFESAAAGKPFISSGCGNAVEIATWTKSGVIVKSIQKKDGYTSIDINTASEVIEKLLSTENNVHGMGMTGRKNWQENYTWEKISLKYLGLYTA